MASSLESLRRALYKTQRGIGDYQAAKRGPDVLAKRVARRYATRTVFGALRRKGWW